MILKIHVILMLKKTNFQRVYRLQKVFKRLLLAKITEIWSNKVEKHPLLSKIH
jgi:hypothetical protein